MMMKLARIWTVPPRSLATRLLAEPKYYTRRSISSESTSGCTEESRSSSLLEPKDKRILPFQRKSHRVFSTLNPLLTQYEDVVDVSGRQTFTVRVGRKTQAPLRLAYYNPASPDPGKHAPFPSSCRGFPYYYEPKGIPKIMGELRFRLTPEDEPLNWERGTDLKLPNGSDPWTFPLLHLLRKRANAEMLIEDSQITREFADYWHSIIAEKQPKIHSFMTRFLHTLNQPWQLSFQSYRHPHMIVTESSVGHVIGPASWFLDGRGYHDRTQPRKFKLPIKGSAMVCFERSQAPEHVGLRVIVLRLLNYMEKPEYVDPAYDGHIRVPEEGELLTVLDKRGVRRVWLFDVDKEPKRKTMEDLALLLSEDGESSGRSGGTAS